MIKSRGLIFADWEFNAPGVHPHRHLPSTVAALFRRSRSVFFNLRVVTIYYRTVGKLRQLRFDDHASRGLYRQDGCACWKRVGDCNSRTLSISLKTGLTLFPMDTHKTPNLVLQTSYFNHPRTWIFRAVQFSVAVFVLYLVDLYEMPNGLNLLYVCSVPIAMLCIALPVDDLAVDQDGIYFIRRSLLSIFNSTKTHQISTIKRVGFYSISRAPSVFSLLVPVPNVFRIEFTFQDDSSESIDLMIRKKDLQKIVSEFRRLQKSLMIAKSDATTT